jgi:flagellar biosynthetic protein FliR
MNFELLKIAEAALGSMDIMWTLVLLIVRFTSLIALLPGIGAGVNGLTIRMPAVIVLAVASCVAGAHAAVPTDWMTMIVQVVGEVLFGLCLALIPLLMVAGVQLAGNLASTTMGLQPSQLIDPTSQVPLPDVSKIFGDLSIMLFLMMGGHHVIIYAAAGLGGEIVPGTFMVGGGSIDTILEQTLLMWRMGATVAAPVVVALLLANFVMGLISKAVPSVNIFIVSFPLTIGVGLFLSVLMIPELMTIVDIKVRTLEASAYQVTRDAVSVAPIPPK